MYSSETPEEKAKRLGVPVLPAAPVHQRPTTGTSSEGVGTYIAALNTVVAVCGACAREIRKVETHTPCGNQRCPFGVFSNL